MQVNGKITSVALMPDGMVLVSVQESPLEGVKKNFHSRMSLVDAQVFTLGSLYAGDLNDDTTSTEMTLG